MEVFAVRYVEAIADGALPIRFGDLATASGVTAQTVSDWRHHTPGFHEWLGAILTRYVSSTWPAVKAVAVRMALRGSIEHMKFLRELMEPKDPATPPPGTPGSTSPLFGAVIVNLPLPPAELEGHPTVRALLETPPTIDVTAVSA